MIHSSLPLSHPHDATDPDRLNTRTRTGILTPAFSNAVRSIQRLLGVGPIRVSQVPAPDIFDLEQDCDAETDAADTLRSTSSRAWRNGLLSLGRSSYSITERTPTRNQAASESSQSSAPLDPELDDGRGHDSSNVVGDSGSDDQDTAGGNEDEVMLISRNGQDFSMTGSVISEPIGNSSVESDRRSIEVVPPTPTASNKLFRKGSGYHTRSASTPHLHTPFSDMSAIRPFSPSTHDLSDPRRHHLPEDEEASLSSPIPIAARRAALINLQPLREGPHGMHYYTAATPPVGAQRILRGSPSPPRPRRIPAPLAPAADYSPPLSPLLRNYAPSYPGRAHPRSPYIPPGSVPSSPIRDGDPQNLIPSAVRGAGYNPFQHARSTSDLG